MLDVKSGGEAALFGIARGAADPPSVHEIALVYFQPRALPAALERAGGTEGTLTFSETVPVPSAIAIIITFTEAITVTQANPVTEALPVAKAVALAVIEA